MDNNLTSPATVVNASNVLDIIRELRTDAVRHQQLLEQVTVFLQQSDLPLQDTAQLVWSPEDSAIDFSRLPNKVHQIEKQQDKSPDIAARLKATGLGRFYITHLKQYPSVRRLIAWTWRNFYPIYVNYVAIHLRKRNAKRWRQLITLREFVKTNQITIIQVTDTAQVETPAPEVFPASDQGYLISPHDRYSSPHIYVATIKDGMIYGGTNLILKNDEVICHDLYDFERDYTSEETHGRNLIDPGKSRIRWLLHDDSPAHLPAAAAFVDACAPNYAHWLTEVLPRIVAFCSEEQFKGIPIVVNDGLHKNILESLFLVAGEGREIVTLPIGRALQVDALYLTSVAGYVPFERRNNKFSDHSHGVFSPWALESLRKKVFSFAEKLPEQTWPEKIYLRRNSGIRKITNATELEELLIAQNYVIVEPEKLTFLQQVQLFSRAKVIIGSSGAALASMIFARPNARMLILIGKYPDTSYWYWQNIACASGLTVLYGLGAPVDGAASGIHSDFYFNTDFLPDLEN
ncbi:MAG: glycosyltransferase family 61 protein [Burkholderiales bacterium]|nr:glycosyltransferase family 61 protein [Burkholderiales bacterium]